MRASAVPATLVRYSRAAGGGGAAAAPAGAADADAFADADLAAWPAAMIWSTSSRRLATFRSTVATSGAPGRGCGANARGSFTVPLIR